MKDFKRSHMIYFILGYILVWYGLSLLAVKWLGMTAVEALGLGTAGGIFLSMAKDAWQYLWGMIKDNTTPKPPAPPTG